MDDLIVNFDSDTPTSSRVLLTWLDKVKTFFFTKEGIMQLYTLVVFYGELKCITKGLFSVGVDSALLLLKNLPNCQFGHSSSVIFQIG